ncbi:hypothetical protein ACH5RR_026869 [Cinchona calisaya]|uniref:Leucine-rich repeat family protein n=1 Tax=Cinchona calisaya TaxID=153742 RepID=A0ABD2Z3T9_9GENT
MVFRIFFCGLTGSCKKVKGGNKSPETADNRKGHKTLYVKVEAPLKLSENDEVKSASFGLPVPFALSGAARCKVKVINHESPIGREAEEVAYEGEDEHDETLSMRRDNSDFDFQAHAGYSNEETDQPVGEEINVHYTNDTDLSDQCERKTEKDAAECMDISKSGHLSDPGTGKATFWASPKLLRSCSDLGTRDVFNKMDAQLPLAKSQSFEELQKLAEKLNEEVLPMNLRSPLSVRTHCSADKVILKKHSSSQILPSRSRKLWWKLLLWSHRNLYGVEVSKQPVRVNPAMKQQGGYSSDTLEPRRVVELNKVESPNSFAEECLKLKSTICDHDNQSWDGFHGVSGLWPQNQWVAFPGESSTMSRVDDWPQNQWVDFPGGSSTMSRVDEWVKGLSEQPSVLVDKDDQTDESINFPASPEAGRSPTRSSAHLLRNPTLNVPEEIAHANSVVQSLNSSSSVAHIVGIGLKVVPRLSSFFSLRSVNLSSNFIVHVTPGSLPKGLHTLNLSKNKISTIEGLRELTRLRVLDLSYNRISRIGQGLSNCTLIKELYLAGNKISDVEGLHRLLKLTVLDLSFNKMTTTKALGQLVANYNSLLALNLLGNPIQSNIGDDQLRKTVCSLVPKLAFLNKQPVNPQKAREVGKEAIAKVALGNSSWSSRRKAARKVTQGSSSSFSVHRSSASLAHKNRHRPKSRVQYHSSTKAK